MVIRIGSPYISQRDNGKVALIADISGTNKAFKLWYEVEKEYEQYLCWERSDAFLVAILPWVMMRSSDSDPAVIACDAPVSEQLHHQLTQYYIPVLTANISYYHPTTIKAEVISEKLPSVGAVGTGISGGVDSSYTLTKYMDCEDGGYRLTHGVYYNIGIYGGLESRFEKLMQKKVQIISEECNLRFLIVSSNTCLQLYEKAHAPIVPSIFIGATLSIQKLFSVYYYSSGFSAADFQFSEADAAYYDLLNVHCLSTENTVFYSSGLETTRLQKVEHVTKYSFTYHSLFVCLNSNQDKGNCGRCAKCTRTMAELEALGKLDKYFKVFDLQAFRNNPGYHWGYVLLKSRSESFSKEIIELYRARGGRIPFTAYFSAIKKWVLRGFTAENKNREKIRI